MKRLTISQLDVVELALEQLGLKDNSFKMEILDHLCCLVEDKMDKGGDFENALKSSFQNLSDSDLKKIDRELLFNKKYKIMKNVILITGLILLFTSTFLLSQEQNIPSLRPLKMTHKISASFGEQIHPIKRVKRHHDGIDIVAPLGTPVFAPANGIIEFAKMDRNKFGKNIMIRHDEKHKTFYSHLSKIHVEEGQKIQKGEVIAEVGSTGLSTGPHLHYEVIVNGEKVDPITYMQKIEKAKM